jgi:CubicO group peptidase (beta-lactamase class C family)
VIGGHADPRFAAVREVFAANFDRGEVGAACTVVVDGHVVVDLWGGWADFERTRPWERDTIVNAYSVGKPFVALAVLQLVAAGDVDLDEPATVRWPELRAGQEGATVRDLLSHRAGVPAIRRRIGNDDLWQWDAMTAALAETEPWWPPGTRHTYHTNTYGHLTGELARRVTGLTPGAWLRHHVAGPLGADLWWGVPAAEQHRCAEVRWEIEMPVTEGAWDALDALPVEQKMVFLSYFNPPGFASVGVVNTPEWRAAQVPSTNLHASARGIAQVYAALLDTSSPLLDRVVLDEATRPQSEGWCPVLERDVTFGLGFQPTRPDRPFGPNPRSFGHFGTGGSLGFADPDAGLAFGYVLNSVLPRWQNERNRALVDAVYASL